MSRIKDFTRLYVIYRQCHGTIKTIYSNHELRNL